VAVSGESTNNAIIYSADGITWNSSNTNGKIQSVYYAGGLWLAGYDSNDGIIYSEDDGATWQLTNITSNHYFAFRYANGRWLASGNNDKGIQYSANGKTDWTDSNITGKSFYWFEYADNIWVAEGEDGLYYSEDNGTTWVKSNAPVGPWNFSIWYNEGMWVAGAGFDTGIWYSTDGKVWQRTNVTDGICIAIYTGSLWIASKADANGSIVGKGLLYSTDGITWKDSNITSSFYTVAYGNDTIVTCSMAISSDMGAGTGIFFSK
jgi:photosystem II stability/assembly factor-like uncharacterized protein